jgi:hypothetical protein
MLRRVDLVRTEVSEELSASFIRVTRIGELGTMLAVTSNRRSVPELRSGKVNKELTLFRTSWNLEEEFYLAQNGRLISLCRFRLPRFLLR